MPSSNSRAARLMIRSLTLSPGLPDLVFTSPSFRIDKRFKINKNKLFMIEVYLYLCLYFITAEIQNFTRKKINSLPLVL